MYGALRYCVRAGLRLYCGRVVLDATSVEGVDGPMLLACNHPNGFMDALVVAVHLPQRLHFMARGDAFRHPLAAYLLRALYMIPISRISEGRAELRHTKRSFGQALACLKRGRSVVVFAEGASEHGQGLRPLGKGTARIAWQAWHGTAPAVAVVPVWLRYGHCDGPFSPVQLHTSPPILASGFPPMPEANFLRSFNGALREGLFRLAVQADGAATMEAGARWRKGRGHAITRMLLAAPALIGFLLHAPWYYAVRAFTAWRTKDTVFFGSVLFTLLFLSYPPWLALLGMVGASAGLGAWAFGILLVAPLSLFALRGYRIG